MEPAQEYHKNLLQNPTTINYLKHRRVSRAAIQKYMVGFYDGNPLSKLHNRMLFPVRDQYGELLAFQGRAMATNVEPRYWHTPFEKSDVLYGLYEAKERIVEQRFAILSEGPFDIMAGYDAGYGTLAGLGTAFSLEQAFLIRRYTENILVWYDNDNAGQKAFVRALPLLQKAGLNIRVPVVRLGHDISETWEKHGHSGILRVIHGSTSI